MKSRLALILLLVGAFIVLNLMSSSAWVISQEPSESLLIFHSLLLSLWGVVLGAILEWRIILSVIRADVKLNYVKFIPVVVFLVISFIPHVTWQGWFGVRDPMDNIFLGWVFTPLQQLELNIVLSVIAGILVMRCFQEKLVKDQDYTEEEYIDDEAI